MSQKIAMLCNYELLPERVGGMDYFFWLFDEKCKENDISVDWFFPNISNHGKYEALSIFSSNYSNIETFFVQSQKNNTKDYTHIITHFVELCTPIFSKIKKVSSAKIIAVDHNPRPINGYGFRKSIEKRIKGILFARYTDQFIGVSHYTVQQIVKDFGNHLRKKTVVVYNGVLIDNILVRKERHDEKPLFLVASHLRESKGIQDLILAVSKLPEFIKAELVINVYGDGPYRAHLEHLVNVNQVTNNFIFRGSQSNLNEIYCQYDYLLQPTHMECFSLSILESLAANVPVITTSVGGNEEVITNEENGFIVKPKDISALSDAIAAVFQGKKTIKVNTRHLIAKSYALETMTENHFKLLL